MAGFNFFKIYHNQKNKLVNFLSSRGMERVSCETRCEEGVQFLLELYYTKEPKRREVKWIKELKKAFPIESKNVESYAAVLLVSFQRIVYAITFGSAHFWVSRYSDYEFGIEIASRLLKKFSIKNSRDFAGVRTRSIEMYLAAEKLSYEAGEAVNYIRGTPNDENMWGKNISCGQSVLLRKKTFSVLNIHSLCVQLELALEQPKITEIPTSVQIKDEKAIENLVNKLIDDMLNNRYIVTVSQQQLSGVALLFSDQYEFNVKLPNGEKISVDETLSLKNVIDITKKNFDENYTALFNAQVEASEDESVKYEKPFIGFIEYVDLEENVYLSEGKWYRFDANYLSNIRREVDKIDLIPSEVERFDEASYQIWLKQKQAVNLRVYREMYFNDKLAPKWNYISMDRDCMLFEGATVEIADLIKDDVLYVVKIGTVQKLNYAIDQAFASLRVLERMDFKVLANNSEVRINKICLWLFFERKKGREISRVSDVNSFIFLMKLAQWRKSMLNAGLQPQIRISYK